MSFAFLPKQKKHKIQPKSNIDTSKITKKRYRNKYYNTTKVTLNGETIRKESS